MTDINKMTTGDLLSEVWRRAQLLGATRLAKLAHDRIQEEPADLLAYVPDHAHRLADTTGPELTVLTAEAPTTEQAYNGFTVERGRDGTMTVEFNSVPPGDDAVGIVPTPEDVVAVVRAMQDSADQAQQAEQVQVNQILSYLFGHRPDHAEMFAHQALRNGSLEQRVTQMAAAIRETMASVKGVATFNRDNLTSLSQRLAEIERVLGMREADSTSVARAPEGATAPPPSAEQVASAERGQPIGRVQVTEDSQGLILGVEPGPVQRLTEDEVKERPHTV